MKVNLTRINRRVIENGFLERYPRVVTFIPSKIKNFYKKKLLTEENLAFFKEVKETKALFREKGFPERIINDVPSLVQEINRIKPILDRLAKN